MMDALHKKVKKPPGTTRDHPSVHLLARTCMYTAHIGRLMHLSMLSPRGGGPRDRVGTLIRNKNLESNFLTLGIRFQFKVPHLGEGFEFNISHETENFKPSDHEVKNMCLHLTRLSMIVLLQ